MFTGLPEENIIIITKQTYDLFLEQEHPSDVLALYTFYYYTAKWQKTNQPKSTTGYTAKGLRWSVSKVRRNKKILIDLGIITDVVTRESETNTITGHYIRINYIWKKSTINDIVEKTQPHDFPDGGLTQTVGFDMTNSLSDNNINSLNDDREMLEVDRSTTTKKTYSKESQEYILASYMLELIFQNKPNFRRSALKTQKQKEACILKWCVPIHAMLKTDEIPVERILAVMDYVAKTPFYSVNILSTKKLRKRFDEIESRMIQKGLIVDEELPDENEELTKRIIRAYGILINNRKYVPANPKEKAKFIESSKKMIEFYKDRSIIRENWVQYLGKCLIKNYTDKEKILYPGHLCSDNTWEKLMPQFIADLGVGR